MTNVHFVGRWSNGWLTFEYFSLKWFICSLIRDSSYSYPIFYRIWHWQVTSNHKSGGKSQKSLGLYDVIRGFRIKRCSATVGFLYSRSFEIWNVKVIFLTLKGDGVWYMIRRSFFKRRITVERRRSRYGTWFKHCFKRRTTVCSVHVLKCKLLNVLN